MYNKKFAWFKVNKAAIRKQTKEEDETFTVRNSGYEGPTYEISDEEEESKDNLPTFKEFKKRSDCQKLGVINFDHFQCYCE